MLEMFVVRVKALNVNQEQHLKNVPFVMGEDTLIIDKDLCKYK